MDEIAYLLGNRHPCFQSPLFSTPRGRKRWLLERGWETLIKINKEYNKNK